jgi:hypothetical protein
MVSTNADLKFYLSGTGNTNPFNSYGGPISPTEIQNDQLENLWSNILPQETLTNGFTDYRAIYLKNTNPVDTISNIHVYWAIDDPYTDLEISHRGVNAAVERPLTAFTSPSTIEIGVPPTTSTTTTAVTNATGDNTNSFGIKKFFDDPATPRYYTTFGNTGVMASVDGYRYNWTIPLNLVSVEVGALIKITTPATTASNSFIWFKMGGGLHNTTVPNDACCYVVGIPQTGQVPGPNLLRKECPFKTYHSCTTVAPLFSLPTLTNKEVGIVCVKLNQPPNVFIQCWINQTPTNAQGTVNNDTWVKYMEYLDSGACYQSPYLTPAGASRQETIRVDNSTFTLRFGSTREIVAVASGNPGGPTICPIGQHYDTALGTCVPDDAGTVTNPITDPWLKATNSYASTGAIIPSLPANSFIGIWLRRVIPPNVSNLFIDSSELVVDGSGVG